MLRRHLAALRDLTTKGLIKQFAAKHALVYFGYVDARDDEHQLVRGVTLSTQHTDNHYSVGTFQNYDIVFVERRNVVRFPGKQEETYAWHIMSLDLKHGAFPHIFIDTNHHGPAFYANLALTNPKLQNLPINLEGVASGTRILASLEAYQDILRLLSPQITSTLTQDFKHFDYEITGDQLFVYACNQQTTPALLADMLRIGVWLADRLQQKP